jgi:exodeoxyribonuclease V alpha subunit
VGSLPSVTAGEWLVSEGWWVRDKEHGLEFKATSMKTVPLTIWPRRMRCAKGVKCLLCAPTEIHSALASHLILPAMPSSAFLRWGRKIRGSPSISSSSMPEVGGADLKSDFHFVERDDPERIAATLVKLVQERIPKRFGLDPIRDVQVLCPMNRGSLGVRELNTALQRVLNPPRPSQPAVERFGWRFQTGDKVIQTENDYDKDVVNGNIGTIERIDPVEHEATIRFDDRLVKYDFGELDEVALAYAVTIHKSQGSEFPAVVIPFATQHYMLLQRNLLYTGITRGKRLLVLVGQKKALGIAVRNHRPQRRYSGLLASLRRQATRPA